jgi:hypothetical protein
MSEDQLERMKQSPWFNRRGALHRANAKLRAYAKSGESHHVRIAEAVGGLSGSMAIDDWLALVSELQGPKGFGRTGRPGGGKTSLEIQDVALMAEEKLRLGRHYLTDADLRRLALSAGGSGTETSKFQRLRGRRHLVP